MLTDCVLMLVGWLIWVLRPFETVFQSISGRLPEKGRKKIEMIDERKNVQTTPTRTFCKRSRPLPYCNPSCRTPRHWKFTQHHRTIRPPQRFNGLCSILKEAADFNDENQCFTFLSNNSIRRSHIAIFMTSPSKNVS